MRGKITVLSSIFRLSVEDLEHLNEDGELWFAYEGLKKATRLEIPHKILLGFSERVDSWKAKSFNNIKEVYE